MTPWLMSLAMGALPYDVPPLANGAALVDGPGVVLSAGAAPLANGGTS